jgi:hypothetical protein
MNEMTVLNIVDGARMPRPSGFERCDRLQTQDDKAEDEQHGVEDQQRHCVLLPVLRTAVQSPLEPGKENRVL